MLHAIDSHIGNANIADAGMADAFRRLTDSALKKNPMHLPTQGSASRFHLDFSTRHDLPVSCGTLVINDKNELLLCHVTGHDLWDLPKGMQEQGEAAVKTARRELHEETGLEFAEEMFIEIGRFDFRPDKRLHLFKVKALDIARMYCASHFVHPVTGKPTPEMDGFRWASRDEIPKLCGPNMQRVLLSLSW